MTWDAMIAAELAARARARYTYTCMGCKRELDPDELDEYGHVCDGWWDEHGVFDALPQIVVSEHE